MDTLQFPEDIARLGYTLWSIAGQLEDCDYVDEDQSWLGKVDPRHQPPRGASFAIANVRSLDAEISEADMLAKDLSGEELRRQIREALTLAHQHIGQADVPAEWAVIDGDDEEAINICRTALARAYEECGVALKRLSAAVLVVADEACDRFNRGHASEADAASCRPAYGRDHLFLTWSAEGLTPAAIRDRWNALSDDERRRVCPAAWRRVRTGESGRNVLKQAIWKAKKEKKS